MAVRQTILDNIVTALKGIRDDDDYETAISEVSLFDENKLTADSFNTPLVMVVDSGTEEMVVRDATNTRYHWNVGFHGLVKAGSNDDAHNEVNKLVSTIKEFINSSPSLGSNVLDFQYVNLVGVRFNPNRLLADCMIECRIVYYAVNGSY